MADKLEYASVGESAARYDKEAGAAWTVSGSGYGIEDFEVGTTVASCVARIRLDFLRKVYSVLTLQIGGTALLAVLFMFVTPLNAWILQAGGWVLWPCFVGAIATLIALQCLRNDAKASLRLLTAFTFFEAMTISLVCAAFAASGLGYVVFQAALLTGLVFGSLTVYCWKSQRDFSFLGGFLWATLLVVLGASLLNGLLGLTGAFSPGLAFGTSVLSALLFSGYILFDTSLLIHHLSPDDWVVACVSLYLDVINLFVNLLQILARLQSSSDN
ncbi:hypothetical protein CDCA_CDCA03G1088 [Cyanidium caldarium]|uniref:Transmembrane BAX inhibitor motif-containing protein 4 n=1 Tax=Cyanidium caldarium TaxID=2771 RepID=A0AAV9IS29_CYACA|nr:hypothetical protein CDCA_CDCA03G1088 [Cyanidium caldarium]